jgi:hypothetical protein
MSEKSISKGFLLILLPISFLFVFFVSTWRIWVAVIALLAGLNLFQTYRWQQWCQRITPLFNQAIQQNQGRIAPMDLAVRGNLSGDKAKKFLDTKALEFGATVYDNEDGSQTYYFITSGILGNIFDSSEPPKELAPKLSSSMRANATAFLAAPTAKVLEEELEVISEVKSEHISEAITELVAAKSLLEESTEAVTTVEIVSDQVATVVLEKTLEKSLEKQLVFGSLIQSELAKRLNVYSSTVYKRRNDPDFAEWSRAKDPDGVAWRFSRTTKEFFPLEKGEKA